MSLMEQEIAGVIIGKDYPFPIVDIAEAGKVARKNIWGHKSHETVKQENKRILAIHCR
jgi:deoxyribodipyrimidine photo-lyase